MTSSLWPEGLWWGSKESLTPIYVSMRVWKAGFQVKSTSRDRV